MRIICILLHDQHRRAVSSLSPARNLASKSLARFLCEYPPLQAQHTRLGGGLAAIRIARPAEVRPDNRERYVGARALQQRGGAQEKNLES